MAWSAFWKRDVIRLRRAKPDHVLRVLEAFVVLGLSRLLLGFIDFRRLVGWIGLEAGATPAVVPWRGIPTAQAVGRAVLAAARRTPWQSSCLTQALAAGIMLRRRSLPMELTLGVARIDAELAAHAWLRCGGTWISGESGHDRFSPLSSFVTPKDDRSDPGRHPRPKAGIAALAQMLQLGGDHRIKADPVSGMTRYGSHPDVREDVLSFSSCSASNLSKASWDEILRTLEDVEAMGSQDACRAIRRDLTLGLGLRQDMVDMVLTASGTDAALWVLAAPPIRDTSTLHVILVGAYETGRGIVVAARGQHFASITAQGYWVVAGQSLEGLNSNRRVTEVSLRDAEGCAKPVEVVNAEVAALVQASRLQGEYVRLVVMQGSKTGLCGPDLALAAQMAQSHAPFMDVVVDACQGRLAPDTMTTVLAMDFAMILTGSKFFAGPPFSGAIAFPKSWAERLAGWTVPISLRQYTAREQWPDSLAAVAAQLPPGASPGLILRWRAALTHMAQYHQIPEPLRRQSTARLGQAMHQAIRRSHCLVPLDDQIGDQGIVAFRVRDPKGGAFFESRACHLLHRALNSDMSKALPPHCSPQDKALAARRVLIGRPMALLGTEPLSGHAILRMALSARDVIRSVHPDAAPDAFEADLKVAVGKIELLVRHWGHVVEAMGASSPRSVKGTGPVKRVAQ